MPVTLTVSVCVHEIRTIGALRRTVVTGAGTIGVLRRAVVAGTGTIGMPWTLTCLRSALVASRRVCGDRGVALVSGISLNRIDGTRHHYRDE